MEGGELIKGFNHAMRGQKGSLLGGPLHYTTRHLLWSVALQGLWIMQTHQWDMFEAIISLCTSIHDGAHKLKSRH